MAQTRKALLAAGLVALWSAVVAGADAVSVYDDASSNGPIAASVYGSATCENAGEHCLAVSAFGDAAIRGCWQGRPCTAVSGTGNATTTCYPGFECIGTAISGTGNSSSSWCFGACQSVSGTGHAQSDSTAFSGTGTAHCTQPCNAISATGAASCAGFTCIAASGSSDASCAGDDCMAVSGTSNASCTGDGCFAWSGCRYVGYIAPELCGQPQLPPL